MFRTATLAAALVLTAGCSLFGEDHGEVVSKNPREIKIRIEADAAVEGVRTRPAAEEHCAEYDKKAVWYGHDRDGNMHYKCE